MTKIEVGGAPSVQLGDGSHVVHFYETERRLVQMVTGYLEASLRDGDSLLVVATPAHRSAFEDGLAAAGVDPQIVVETGRLVLLDAVETLGEVMNAGSPSSARFDAIIRPSVRRLAALGRPVRVYGDMVEGLWPEGDVAAALELEKWWTALAEGTPFGLLCAYPLELMAEPSMSEMFGSICDLHSHVIAGAPYPVAESTRRFIAEPHAARLARRYVSTTLREWRLEAIADDAMIVTGELVANAVQHAGRLFNVGLSRTPGGLRAMVGDTSHAVPRPGEPGSLSTTGRGLQMIGKVSSGWGYDLHPGGKVVWADLRGLATELG